MDEPNSTQQADETVDKRRRRALARLGLTAAALYAAPTVTRLDRHAFASSLPSPGPCPPNVRC